MARGWASKAVVSQIQDAGSRCTSGRAVPLDPLQIERKVKLRCLLLDRIRVQGELGRCSNARFQALLDSELAYLDAEITKYEA